MKYTVHINLDESTISLIDQIAVKFYRSNRSQAIEMAIWSLNQFIQENKTYPVLEERKVGLFKAVQEVKIRSIE